MIELWRPANIGFYFVMVREKSGLPPVSAFSAQFTVPYNTSIIHYSKKRLIFAKYFLFFSNLSGFSDF